MKSLRTALSLLLVLLLAFAMVSCDGKTPEPKKLVTITFEGYKNLVDFPRTIYPITGEAGTTITNMPIPGYSGYQFAYWYTTDDNARQTPLGSKFPDNDVTVYPEWTKKVSGLGYEPRTTASGEKYIEITGYPGDVTTFTIPSYVNGIPVTSIGDGLCTNNKNLTGNLVIPEGITYIGENAFEYCSNLQGTLTIPEGVKTIGIKAFKDCNFTGTLTIPEGVETIDEGAFWYLPNMEGELKIPGSVKIIGPNAFFQCGKLQGDLVIPRSVTTLGRGAFNNCSSLGDIYCEVTEKPTGWNREWLLSLPSSSEVYWGNEWSYVDGVPTPNTPN